MTRLCVVAALAIAPLSATKLLDSDTIWEVRTPESPEIGPDGRTP